MDSLSLTTTTQHFTAMKNPNLSFLIISGPRGTNKSAVADHLTRRFSHRLVPVTSIVLGTADKPVPKYPHLVAVTPEQYEIEEHTLVTRDEIDGVKYGTTSEALIWARQQGKIPVFRLRPEKAAEMQRQYGALVHIIEIDNGDHSSTDPIMSFSFAGQVKNVYRARVIDGMMYEVDRVAAEVLEAIG
jgi:hypothetical protein